MKTIVALLLAWLCVAGLADVATSSAAQETAETESPVSSLSVEPEALKVARFDPGAVATVTVVARTTEWADRLVDPKLSATTSPGLAVAIGPPAVDGGDVTWPVTVRVTGDAPDDSAVDFRLAYGIAPLASNHEASASRTQHVRRMRLKLRVTPNRDASPLSDATISIKPGSAQVTDGVGATAYLLVTNTSESPFSVDSVDFSHPTFLRVTATTKPTDVAAHQVLRVPLTISTAETPPAGEQLLLTSITLRRGTGPGQQTGTAVVEHKVTVSIPGVTDALKVLDLPSLLLVPGALVLATWSLLLDARRNDHRKWLDWKSPGFWVTSITISIGIFFILHTIWNTNFLVAYNVKQVAFLWIGCVGLAAVTYFVLYVVQIRRREWREPRTTDSPIDILRKIHRSSGPFYLPGHPYSAGGQKQEIFSLDFPAPEGMVWAIPRMLVQQLTETNAANDHMQKLGEYNDRPGDGRGLLVEALKVGLSRGWIRLDWESGSLSRPQPLPKEQLGVENYRSSPVRVV